MQFRGQVEQFSSHAMTIQCFKIKGFNHVESVAWIVVVVPCSVVVLCVVCAPWKFCLEMAG